MWAFLGLMSVHDVFMRYVDFGVEFEYLRSRMY